MQELHINIADTVTLIEQLQTPVAGKFADNSGGHVFTGKEGQKLLNRLRRDGHYHSFLRFRYPDFRIRQAGVFQGHFFKVNADAGLFSHFADCRRKAAATAIGYPRIQAAVASLEEDVGELLFHDRITDLDRTGRGIGRRPGKRHGGEGNAVNAVPSGAAAGDHHQVTGLLFSRLGEVSRHQAQRTAVNQRVGHVSFIEEHRAI